MEKCYRDIQVWCALTFVSNDAWRFTGECVSAEKRLEEIQKYVSRYKETILLWQFKIPKRDYHLYRWTLSQSDEESSLSYKNEDFEVHFLGDHGT